MNAGIRIRSYLVPAARAVLLVAFAACTLAIARQATRESRPGTMTIVPAAADQCAKACNDTFIKALQDENTRYKKAARECGGNFVCHRDQNYQHRITLQSAVLAHKACRNGCSPQGAGSAGS